MTESTQEQNLKDILIDFDNTIAHNSGHPFYEMRLPVKGAKEYLDKLKVDGWQISIYTTRPYTDKILIKEWLLKYEIPFVEIICGKAFGKYLVDDRAISFKGNWEEAYKLIK